MKNLPKIYLLVLVLLIIAQNLYAQFNIDIFKNQVLEGINERRESKNITKATFNDSLNKICSDLIDSDIASGGKLSDAEVELVTRQRTENLFGVADVFYSYIKLTFIMDYFSGIEKVVANDFFRAYDQYNNGEYFIVNFKNSDNSDGTCYFGLSVHQVNNQLFALYIIISESNDLTKD